MRCRFPTCAEPGVRRPRGAPISYRLRPLSTALAGISSTDRDAAAANCPGEGAPLPCHEPTCPRPDASSPTALRVSERARAVYPLQLSRDPESWPAGRRCQGSGTSLRQGPFGSTPSASLTLTHVAPGNPYVSRGADSAPACVSHFSPRASSSAVVIPASAARAIRDNTSETSRPTDFNPSRSSSVRIVRQNSFAARSRNHQ